MGRDMYQDNMKSRNARLETTIMILRNLLRNNRVQRIVELGCADGSVLIEVSHRLGAHDIYGVDIDDKALKRAEEKGIKVIKHDLNSGQLPFPDEYFDIVLMEEVIEHLVNPDNAIAEARRILVPGGLLVITTPNLAWWLNRLVLLLGYQPYWSEVSTKYNVGKLARKRDEPLSGHLRLFTFKALKELLEIYGFRIVESRGITYRNLPSFFKIIDILLSQKPSLAQIILIVAKKP